MEKLVELITPHLGWLMLGLMTAVWALAARYSIEAVGLLGGKSVDFLRKLKQGLNENRFLSRIEADDFLMEHMIEAVQHTQETYIADLKEGKEDGKLTEFEIRSATDRAIATLKDGIFDVDWKDLRAVIGGDLETVLRRKLPALVSGIKATGLLSRPISAEVIGVEAGDVLEDITSDPGVA